MPYVLINEIARSARTLVCHDGCGAVGISGAVAGSFERGLKEGLCAYRRRTVDAALGCGGCTPESCFQRSVGVGEGLSALRHHVGNRVKVIGLIFVVDEATDIPDLNKA